MKSMPSTFCCRQIENCERSLFHISTQSLAVVQGAQDCIHSLKAESKFGYYRLLLCPVARAVPQDGMFALKNALHAQNRMLCILWEQREYYFGR